MKKLNGLFIMYVTALYVRSAVRLNIRILNLFVMRILMEWKNTGI